jgi:hypothetical protein
VLQGEQCCLQDDRAADLVVRVRGQAAEVVLEVEEIRSESNPNPE